MADGGSHRGDAEGQADACLVVQNGQTLLAAVCDGMGKRTPGPEARHPAAALAISTIRAAFERDPTPEAAVTALSDANRAILLRARAAQAREPGSDRHWAGMGTTVALAVFVPGCAHLAHVGDVRIYRLHGAALERLTTDHSLLNDYVRRCPNLSEEDRANFPHSDVIIRALGMKDELEVERREVATSAGDVFILCSSAVTSTLDEADIASILRRREPCSASARALLDAVRGAPTPPKNDATVILHIVSPDGV